MKLVCVKYELQIWFGNSPRNQLYGKVLYVTAYCKTHGYLNFSQTVQARNMVESPVKSW